MDKIQIGKNYLEFHKNKKLVTLLKPIYREDSSSNEKFRRINVPTRVLYFAMGVKEELESGQRKQYDGFWEVFEDEFAGEDYCCFQKTVNTKRSGVSEFLLH